MPPGLKRGSRHSDTESVSLPRARISPPENVPLTDMLAALSFALDLTEGQPPPVWDGQAEAEERYYRLAPRVTRAVRARECALGRGFDLRARGHVPAQAVGQGTGRLERHRVHDVARR